MTQLHGETMALCAVHIHIAYNVEPTGIEGKNTGDIHYHTSPPKEINFFHTFPKFNRLSYMHILLYFNSTDSLFLSLQYFILIWFLHVVPSTVRANCADCVEVLCVMGSISIYLCTFSSRKKKSHWLLKTHRHSLVLIFLLLN